MTSYKKSELEALLVNKAIEYAKIAKIKKAVEDVTRILYTNKKNTEILDWNHRRYPERRAALKSEDEKKYDYFNRNVEIAKMRFEDIRNREASEYGGDIGDVSDEEEIPYPLIKGLELLKKKSGGIGYHGEIDNLVGLGKYNQGDHLLLVDKISTHGIKHFCLVPHIDNEFDLSSLFYPEDEGPLLLVYTVSIERPVLFVKN